LGLQGDFGEKIEEQTRHPFFCDECMERLPLRIVPADTKSQKYSCFVCKTATKTKKGLFHHLRIFHAKVGFHCVSLCHFTSKTQA